VDFFKGLFVLIFKGSCLATKTMQEKKTEKNNYEKEGIKVSLGVRYLCVSKGDN
jgi:hypothetical protein